MTRTHTSAFLPWQQVDFTSSTDATLHYPPFWRPLTFHLFSSHLAPFLSPLFPFLPLHTALLTGFSHAILPHSFHVLWLLFGLVAVHSLCSYPSFIMVFRFEYFSDVIHVLYSILYSVFFCGSIYLLLERLGIRRAILFDTCVLVTFGSSRGGCLTFTLKNFMDVECFRKISLLSIILKNTNPFNGKQAFDFQWVKYSGHTMSIWIPILTLSQLS